MGQNLLSVNGLKTQFPTLLGVVRAVDGIELDVEVGETVGLVGESGSGKTVTALSIMKLVPPPGRIVEGRILFNGANILELSEAEMRRVRGEKIAMCFQDPMTYLNPVMRVGEQIAENITLHEKLERQQALGKAIEMMDLVGIPHASERCQDYPHQLSGGMRQRILLAMAISCRPKLLIADEPTTSVDVIIQAQILKMLMELKRKLDTSVLLITHNLGIVAQLCDKIAVMYAGNIVEYAGTAALFDAPKHPYTETLLGSIPRLDLDTKSLKIMRGSVPDLINPPSGCTFHPRCPYAKETCSKQTPGLEAIEKGRLVKCLLYN